VYPEKQQNKIKKMIQNKKKEFALTIHNIQNLENSV
jgi:hypothetical protein